METKSLLYGLIGFFIGGFIVAVAATTFDKPNDTSVANSMSEMSMMDMAGTLKNKTGDEFDAEFIAGMIAHHEGAVEMARLSAANAKHDEIKQLSTEIISAQKKEIAQMRQWQTDWGYSSDDAQMHMGH